MSYAIQGLSTPMQTQSQQNTGVEKKETEKEILKKKVLRRSQPRTNDNTLNFSGIPSYERSSVNAALY